MTAKLWTDDEVDVLLDNYFDGVGLKTIAAKLERNMNGIVVKLSKMGMAYSKAELSYRQRTGTDRTNMPWTKQDKHLYDVWREKEKGGKEYIARVLRRSVFDIEKHSNPRKSRKGFGL